MISSVSSRDPNVPFDHPDIPTQDVAGSSERAWQRMSKPTGRGRLTGFWLLRLAAILWLIVVIAAIVIAIVRRNA
ncbi:MAG TPA: hypothetical protein VGB55_10060 [Tepidisphaeraceae bacterium]|jgi:hypothetical protein